MTDAENPEGDLRLRAIYVGFVVDRTDPERLGRVKINIPGVAEPTGWAFPLGSAGGGGKRRGNKRVPPIDAEVAVFFNQGDPDFPVFLPGFWGHPDGVTELPGGNLDPDTLPEGGELDPGEETPEELDAANSPDVHVDEFRDYMIVVDEREGKSRLFFRHKPTGDFLEYDGVGLGWIIRATTGIQLITQGIVSIEGLQVQVNGRPVYDNPNPI